MLYFILWLVGCIKSFTFAVVYMALPFATSFFTLTSMRAGLRGGFHIYVPHFFTDTCMFFVQSRFLVWEALPTHTHIYIYIYIVLKEHWKERWFLCIPLVSVQFEQRPFCAYLVQVSLNISSSFLKSRCTDVPSLVTWECCFGMLYKLLVTESCL